MLIGCLDGIFVNMWERWGMIKAADYFGMVAEALSIEMMEDHLQL